jgi:dephospho-CoA kinase
MIIGITGKSGSGKSTYAEKLSKENGYAVVHIDDIGHKVLESDYVKNKLVEIFGADSVTNGVVDRKYVGDLIFTYRHLYKELSDLVWDDMKLEIDKLLDSHPNIILDWLLLPHTHYWKMCDKKILVVANEDDRVARVMARDNISAEYLNKRDTAGINYDNIEFDELIKNKYISKGGNIK